MASKYDDAARLDDKEVQAFLASIPKNIKAFKDGNAKIAAVITAIAIRDVNEHFEQEMGPNGAWKPWSLSYRAFMRRVGYDGNKILSLTGRLRANLKPQNWRSVKDGFLIFNDAQTASGFPYAFAHDNDTTPRTRLPRRSFMWLSNTATSKIAEAVLEMFMKGEIK